jgi:hypothetical protein
VAPRSDGDERSSGRITAQTHPAGGGSKGICLAPSASSRVWGAVYESGRASAQYECGSLHLIQCYLDGLILRRLQ